MRSKLIHVVLAGVTMVALGTYVERGSGSTIAPKNDAVAGAVERGAKWLVSVQLASNAFPSSSNSSTLSESARLMSRNPCRSPDWALERDPRTFSNAGASRWLFCWETSRALGHNAGEDAFPQQVKELLAYLGPLMSRGQRIERF
jgi:hypothetical protein